MYVNKYKYKYLTLSNEFYKCTHSNDKHVTSALNIWSENTFFINIV